MNPPIKPQKPKVNEKPPEKDFVFKKYILVNIETNDVLLNDRSKSNYFKTESLNKKQIAKLNELVGHLDYEIFLTGEDYEGPYLGVIYKQEKPKDEYDKELQDYNNRFENYNKALLEYERQKKDYQQYLAEKKIKKLEAEIAKLKK
jgi:hypothetical protein